MAANIEELQASITRLSPEEFARFREWFDDFIAEQWDRQFEDHALNGKLDGIANKALDDLRKGKCSDL